MQTITIADNQRIISSGNGVENAVQYQVKNRKVWKTVLRKSYSGHAKCNVIDDITREYRNNSN